MNKYNKRNKYLVSIGFATSLLLTGLSVGACEEYTGSAFEELDREGVELSHYTVTYKNGYYKAVGSDGSLIRFKLSDAPDTLIVGDRIRTFSVDGKLLSAEYVKPEKIEYKIVSKFKDFGNTYWTGESKSEGLIQFSLDELEGKEPTVGDTVIAEFDRLYIEDGLIKVYKKGAR